MLPTLAKRGGVNEVIPNMLYQRASFLTWPHDRKIELLNALDVTVVVNLWMPVDSDLAFAEYERVYLNWHLPTNRVVDDADVMVKMISGLMRAGRRVLVHCEAGRNRSAWLCARLVQDRLQVSGQDALDIVYRGVPAAKINGALVRDLMRFA
jgi:protein-tyrosine phosphatase